MLVWQFLALLIDFRPLMIDVKKYLGIGKCQYFELVPAGSYFANPLKPGVALLYLAKRPRCRTRCASAAHSMTLNGRPLALFYFPYRVRDPPLGAWIKSLIHKPTIM